MVTPLLVLLALAALQMVLVGMVRMAVTTIALESARVGAAWDADFRDAQDHAEQLLNGQLRQGTISHLSAREVQIQGVRTMEVRVVISPMTIGPLPTNELTITAHAVEESQ